MQGLIGKAALAAALVYPAVGLAYVGPGLGVSALALMSGLLGSILLPPLHPLVPPQAHPETPPADTAHEEQNSKPQATEDQEPD